MLCNAPVHYTKKWCITNNWYPKPANWYPKPANKNQCYKQSFCCDLPQSLFYSTLYVSAVSFLGKAGSPNWIKFFLIDFLGILCQKTISWTCKSAVERWYCWTTDVHEVYEISVNEYYTCIRLIFHYLFTTTGKGTFHFGLEALLKMKSRSTVEIGILQLQVK